MKASVQSQQSSFKELEQFLQANETDLCAASVQRYLAVFPDHHIKVAIPYVNMVTGGAEYVHRLALIAAALHPSETTLQREYEWTTSGPLVRYGIGLEQQLTLLQSYWASVRAATRRAPAMIQAIEALEASMTSVLHDVFSDSVSRTD